VNVISKKIITYKLFLKILFYKLNYFLKKRYILEIIIFILINMSIELKYGPALSGKQARVIHTSDTENRVLITGNLNPSINLGFNIGEPLSRWEIAYINVLDINGTPFDPSITITGGLGLSGGGDLSTNQVIDIDIPSLTTDSTPDGAADFIVTYDASAGTHKKVLLNNLPSTGGETNTASNVGVGGVGVFKQKTGVNLEFKNVNAGSSKVTITNDGANNEIDIDIAEANVDHNALLNFVANKHIDHSTVSVTGGIGLSGGGAITTSSAIDLDINSLTTDGSPDLGADYVATYDASAAGHKKVLLSALSNGEANTGSNVGVAGVGVFKQKTGVNLEFKNVNAGSSKITVTDDVANNEIDINIAEANVDHNALLNFVANKHIDHSTVSVTGGVGLTGGGAITTSSIIDLNIPGLTLDTDPDFISDFVATFDTSASQHKKVLLNSLISTASNVGNVGVGIFKQKIGVNLEFKNITNNSGKILVLDDTGNSVVEIDVVEANINHDALLNFFPDEHIDHSTVSVTGGIGLSGGGAITTSSAIDLDIPSLTTDASPDGGADFIVTYDTSASAHKKVLINNLPSTGETNTASNVGVGGVGVFKQKTGVNLEFKNINAASSKVTVANDAPNNEIDIDIAEANINHDALLNFVANEHIDHSGVSVTGGIGLSGGGAITTSSAIDLDIDSLTADANPDSAADFLVFYDTSAVSHKKVLIDNLGISSVFQQTSDETETSTTAVIPTFTQKIRLTTTSLASGNYYITWYYEWRFTNATNDFVARVQINDTTTIMEHQQEPIDTGADQSYNVSGFYYAVALSGVNTIDLDFARSSASGTAFMKRARLAIWRIY
jgi:uncharacterized lipoprotein YehR (DUF1307 family)